MKKILCILTIVCTASLFLSNSGQPAELKKVNFSLDYVISGRHAPWFVTFEKGFYADEGLDVTITRGYGANDTIKRVVSGNAAIGFCSFAPVILARDKGNNIKSFAVIYAKNPMSFFSLQKTGIVKPKDLEGHSIGGEPGDSHRVLFPAFAAANGVDATKVTWVSIGGAAKSQMLIAGKVDAIGNFIMQLPILEKQTPQISVMPWANYGLDLISNALIAKDEYIAQNPNIIAQFLKASVKGFEYAFEHLDEAVKTILKFQPTLDPDISKKEIEIVRGLVLTDTTKKFGIGYATEEQIQYAVDLIGKYYKLEHKISVSQLHTNIYLPKK